MARSLKEIRNFNHGTFLNASEKDIPDDSSSFSLNVNPESEGGVLSAIKTDKLWAVSGGTIVKSVLPIPWGYKGVKDDELDNIDIMKLEGIEAFGNKNLASLVFVGTEGRLEKISLIKPRPHYEEIWRDAVTNKHRFKPTTTISQTDDKITVLSDTNAITENLSPNVTFSGLTIADTATSNGTITVSSAPTAGEIFTITTPDGVATDYRIDITDGGTATGELISGDVCIQLFGHTSSNAAIATQIKNAIENTTNGNGQSIIVGTPISTALTLDIRLGDLTNYLTVGSYFSLVASAYDNDEIMKVKSIIGQDIYVERGCFGTIKSSYSNGTRFKILQNLATTAGSEEQSLCNHFYAQIAEWSNYSGNNIGGSGRHWMYASTVDNKAKVGKVDTGESSYSVSFDSTNKTVTFVGDEKPEFNEGDRVTFYFGSTGTVALRANQGFSATILKSTNGVWTLDTTPTTDSLGTTEDIEVYIESSLIKNCTLYHNQTSSTQTVGASEHYKINDWINRKTGITNTYSNTTDTSISRDATEAPFHYYRNETTDLSATADTEQLFYPFVNDKQVLEIASSYADIGGNTTKAITLEDTTIETSSGVNIILAAGNIIKIDGTGDAEYMKVVKVDYSNITVERGWGGSTVYEHSTDADIHVNEVQSIYQTIDKSLLSAGQTYNLYFYAKGITTAASAIPALAVTYNGSSFSETGTWQLADTDPLNGYVTDVANRAYSSSASNITQEKKWIEFGALSTEYNGAGAGDLTGGWKRYKYTFTIPEEMTVLTDIGIEFTNLGLPSSFGLDQLDLLEDTVMYVPQPLGIGAAFVLNNSGIKDLIVYDKNQKDFSVLRDIYNATKEGVSVNFSSIEKSPFAASDIESQNLTSVRNNRELHIGLGGEGQHNFPQWIGYLNHSLFGVNNSGTLYQDEDIVHRYESGGGALLSKITVAGEHEHLDATWDNSGDGTLKIEHTNHSMKVGDNIVVREWGDAAGDWTGKGVWTVTDETATGVNDFFCRRYTALDANPSNNNFLPATGSTRNTNNGKVCYRPHYYYGIRFGDNHIYRITPSNRLTGETTIAEDTTTYPAGKIEKSSPLSITVSSITTCHSKSDENGIGGGKVYVLGQNSSTAMTVDVQTGYDKWKSTALTEAPFQMIFKSFKWSNEREDGNITASKGVFGGLSEESTPTIIPSGVVSDILETKGPTKDFVREAVDLNANDEEHFDTRLWVQFHPGGESSFSPGARFLFCGKSLSTNTGSGGTLFMGDRTPATTSTKVDAHYGMETQLHTADANSYGGVGHFFLPIIPNAGTNQSMRRNYYYNAHKLNDARVYVMEYIAQREHHNSHSHDWSYDVGSNADGNGHFPYLNFGNNIGFIGGYNWATETSIQIKVARYGLFPVSDNDRDGVLDGTGVVVPSTTTYHALGHTDADFENPYGHPSQRMTAHAVGLIAGSNNSQWSRRAGKMQALSRNRFSTAHVHIDRVYNEAPSNVLMNKFIWICSDIHLGDYQDLTQNFHFTSVSQSATTVSGTSLIRFTVSETEDELFKLQAGDIVFVEDDTGQDFSGGHLGTEGISAQVVSVDVTNKRITTDLRWEDYGGGSGPSATTGWLQPYMSWFPADEGDEINDPPGWDWNRGLSTPARRIYHFAYGEPANDGTVFTESSEHTDCSFYTKQWFSSPEAVDNYWGSPGILNYIDKLNFKAGYLMRPFTLSDDTFEDLIIGNNTTVDTPSFPDHLFHVKNSNGTTYKHYNTNNAGAEMVNSTANRLFITSKSEDNFGKSNLYAIDLNFMYPDSSLNINLPYGATGYEAGSATEHHVGGMEDVPIVGNTSDWNEITFETYIEGRIDADCEITAHANYPNATLNPVITIGADITKGASVLNGSGSQTYNSAWSIRGGFNRLAGCCITIVDQTTGQMQTRSITSSKPADPGSITASSGIKISVHYPFAHLPVNDDYFFIWGHADVCTAPVRLVKNIQYSEHIPIKSHPSQPHTDQLIPMFNQGIDVGDVSNIATDGTTLTVTTAKRHNLTTGDIVTIDDTANFQGTADITVTAPTIFTMPQTYLPGTSHTTETSGSWSIVNGNQESSISNPILVDTLSPAFKAMYGGFDLRDDRTASVSGVADDSGPQQLTTSANHLMETGDEIVYDAGSSDLTGNYTMVDDGANLINIPTTETETDTGTVYKQNFELFTIEKGGSTKVGKIRSSFSRWDVGNTYGNPLRYDTTDDNLKFFKQSEALIRVEGASPSASNDFFEADKDYKYRISLIYDGYQEGPLSEGEWVYNEAVTRSTISITISIVEASKRLTHVCLYRKDNPFDYYKLVKEIKTESGWSTEDNSLYKHTVLDNGEIEASYEARTGMSEVLDVHNVKYGISEKIDGYLFAGDCVHSKIINASNMIFRSRPGMFSLFDYVNDTIQIESKPTALANFNGRLYAFDETSTYKINPQSLVIEDKFEGVGCLNRNSVLITEFGMFFADKNGAYLHNGSAPVKISGPIHKGGEISTVFGGTDNIKDVSWDNVVTKSENKDVVVCYDANISCVLFKVEYLGLEVDGTSKSIQYVWAYHLPSKRWDLWELSENSLIGSPFNGDDGSLYIPINNAIFKLRGGSKNRDYTWISKKLSMDEDSTIKVFNRVKLNSVDNNINLGGANLDSSDRLLIATNTGLIPSNDITYSSKDINHSQYKLSGSNKKGRWIQFKLENMKESIDSLGVIFRKKTIK